MPKIRKKQSKRRNKRAKKAVVDTTVEEVVEPKERTESIEAIELEEKVESDEDVEPMKGLKSEELMEEVIEQEFNTQIDVLDDYFLYNLFSYFGVKDKLSIERVCKRWQTIVRELLVKQTGLGTTWSTDKDYLCLDSNKDHCVTGGDIRDAIHMSNGWFYDLTEEKSIENLEYISLKCPNIRCLHISHTIIDSESIEKVVQIFPDLECLHLKSNILKAVIVESDNKKAIEEWNSIGKTLGPIIRHLLVDPHYEYRMNEQHMKNLIQHFRCIEELRIGNHFEREVVGKFVTVLSKSCKLFYCLGKELAMDALNSLVKNQSQRLTHLSYFANPLRTIESVKKIGENFQNLVKLKINLSFNEIIHTASSPITQLTNLKEFAIDLNTFPDTQVDDGLIWCIKDGLPKVKVLEISRACLSSRGFNALNWCLPQIQKLILKSVEIQCMCDSVQVMDRTERYTCSMCIEKCWQSVANLNALKELHHLSQYYRYDKLKPLNKEFCQLLPQFQCLRYLWLFRYDISGTNLFESLNQLMKKTEPNDVFVLKLESIPYDWSTKIKTRKVFIIKNEFML